MLQYAREDLGELALELVLLQKGSDFWCKNGGTFGLVGDEKVVIFDVPQEQRNFMDGGFQFILFAEISMLLRRNELQLLNEPSQPLCPFILAEWQRNRPRLELAGHVRFDYNANGMEKSRNLLGSNKLWLVGLMGG